MSKPDGSTSLGSSIYLFKSQTNASDCMISAHGGYVSENRSFKVPGSTTIHFYGDHGAALLDPQINDFARKLSRADPIETVTGGNNCRNYLLTKYQGAHAGEGGKETVETYQQVASQVTTSDLVRSKKFQTLLKSTGRSQEITMESLMENWGGSIVTIRNRWNVFLGVPLATVISEVKKHSPAIRVFHCVFCRSYMLGEDKLEAQGVRYRN